MPRRKKNVKTRTIKNNRPIVPKWCGYFLTSSLGSRLMQSLFTLILYTAAWSLSSGFFISQKSSGFLISIISYLKPVSPEAGFVQRSNSPQQCTGASSDSPTKNIHCLKELGLVTARGTQYFAKHKNNANTSLCEGKMRKTSPLRYFSNV